MRLCDFCSLEQPAHAFEAHVEVCGSRTDKCDKCLSVVMLKNMNQHHESGCQYGQTQTKSRPGQDHPAAHSYASPLHSLVYHSRYPPKNKNETKVAKNEAQRGAVPSIRNTPVGSGFPVSVTAYDRTVSAAGDVSNDESSDNSDDEGEWVCLN